MKIGDKVLYTEDGRFYTIEACVFGVFRIGTTKDFVEMVAESQMVPTPDRISEIRARMDWMNENLSGCDWCCGGGDEEMDELISELKELDKTPAC
jgi:hypothetical protein